MKKLVQLLATGILFPLFMNAQWVSKATGFATPSRALWDISVPDANTAWGIAYDATIGIFGGMVPEFTRTIDGGNSFVPGKFPYGYIWSNITAIDGMTAWASVVDSGTGLNGSIFKTTDGGTTWNEQGAGTIFNSTSSVDFVYFWNANDGVTVGDPNPGEFEIYTTADGGATWVAVPGASIPDPVSNEYGVWKSYCVLGNDIWFGTSKARIFHSSDKGLTWSVINTGISLTFPESIDYAFWSSNEGIVRKYDNTTNTNAVVLKTSDGGATWNPVTVDGKLYGSYYTGIAYVPGTTSTLVSTGLNNVASSGSSYSNDGGNTWNSIDPGVWHNGAKFFNNTTGWSSSHNTSSTQGGILKYTGQPLGIENTETGKEIYFNVYPNPSEGKIMVQLNNAENKTLAISVLDLCGRTIFENKYGEPGEFFIRTLDLSALAKGVYVLKVGNGNLNLSKKIVVR